ncbi:DUF1877 domain-containing protein [Streptomyces sp. NPDC057499]|uniref:DUF1877 domain-containing protein n=1 Tax=Streptomyces sp. NPDC057499 TaxID=3346150 RepID=UPI0036AE8503
MALSQQLARVSPQYLERCREAAKISPDGDPRWDPPEADVLDLDRAVRELLRLCRRMWPDARQGPVLRRAVDGDSRSAVSFLDHHGVHDGLDAPPALLAPAAVSVVARELVALDIAPLLAEVPAYREAGGFSGFAGDPCAYLEGHFARLREFYRVADEREMAVVAWVD